MHINLIIIESYVAFIVYKLFCIDTVKIYIEYLKILKTNHCSAVTGPVQSKDMKTPSSLLSSSPIFMKDAQCAETNENEILQCLRFLFFEL